MINVEEIVHKIIEDVTRATDVNNTQQVDQDLGADSLDVIEIIIALEEEFEIAIDDNEVKDIKTVGDIVNKVKERVG